MCSEPFRVWFLLPSKEEGQEVRFSLASLVPCQRYFSAIHGEHASTSHIMNRSVETPHHEATVTKDVDEDDAPRDERFYHHRLGANDD
jgi:hypothetical protein